MKDLTILIPCLNEARTIGTCIQRAQKLIEMSGLEGEVVVCDNGSTDGSIEISHRFNARVVECSRLGYGSALRCGIAHATGKFIVIGDGDDSYHFDEALPMLRKLQDGFDVCMGTRFKGKILPGAMPLLNRYLGNPALSSIGKVLFKTDISDFHCGMRAFRTESIARLEFITTGMEWASEMVIKARLAGLAITEVPLTLHKDGRNRPPHMRPWRDGWRHLRFMLLHSPTWIFTFPGIVLMTIGLVCEVLLSQRMISFDTTTFDLYALLVMAFVLILGVQMTFTGLFAQVYSRLTGILPYHERFNRILQHLTLERVLMVSLIIGLVGLWGVTSGFTEHDHQVTMRRLIPSIAIVCVAVQGIFNGFMLSILFLKTTRSISENCEEPG